MRIKVCYQNTKTKSLTGSFLEFFLNIEDQTLKNYFIEGSFATFPDKSTFSYMKVVCLIMAKQVSDNFWEMSYAVQVYVSFYKLCFAFSKLCPEYVIYHKTLISAQNSFIQAKFSKTF